MYMLTILCTCQAGIATRYAIIALLFGSVLLFFLYGYHHTQRRLRRGQEPSRLFRWMARRQQYYSPQPYGAYPQPPNHAAYQMENHAPPPPAYTHAGVPPPVYQPPHGASKAMADQDFHGTNRPGEASASGGLPPPPTAARQ